MAAVPADIASEPLQQEFSLTGRLTTDHETYITGIERGFDRAMAVARALAETGWNVTLRNADPYLEDEIEIVVRRRQ